MRPVLRRTSYDTFTVRPLAAALGGVVEGWDIRKLVERDHSAWGTLKDAVHDHSVIVLLEQDLGERELRCISSALGGSSSTPFLEEIAGQPGLVRVVKEADEIGIGNFGGDWHSDWSFLPEPPVYTVLYSVDLPAIGGDTVWSNHCVAFQNLSSGFRDYLRGLHARHSAGRSYSLSGIYSRTIAQRSMGIALSDDALQEYSHPVVVRHPPSGAEALFVNEAYTTGLDGCSERESRATLDFLFRWLSIEEFTCRLTWSAGTLVIWDNRCTSHRALNEYDGMRRELIRGAAGSWVPQR